MEKLLIVFYVARAARAARAAATAASAEAANSTDVADAARGALDELIEAWWVKFDKAVNSGYPDAELRKIISKHPIYVVS